MSLFEFAKSLEIFDGKILLTAVAVFAATGLIKLFIPTCCKRYVTLLPFLLGIIFYGGYGYLFENTDFSTRTVSLGLQCGIAATFYYVVYKQFFKDADKPKLAVISSLVSELINGEIIADAAKEILEIIGRENPLGNLFAYLRDNRTSGSDEETMYLAKNLLNAVKS